jgi:hypothetical protein
VWARVGGDNVLLFPEFESFAECAVDCAGLTCSGSVDKFGSARMSEMPTASTDGFQET